MASEQTSRREMCDGERDAEIAELRTRLEAAEGRLAYLVSRLKALVGEYGEGAA